MEHYAAEGKHVKRAGWGLVLASASVFAQKRSRQIGCVVWGSGERLGTYGNQD